jgi:hypothetical protein
LSVRWTRGQCSVYNSTFGHAVQTTQVASLRDTDTQIVMLTIELVGQEVGKGLCMSQGLSSVRQVDLRL